MENRVVVSEEYPLTLQKGSDKQVSQSQAQKKCLYKNGCTICNKQEVLVATAQLENYDLITSMETWWDESPS